MKALILNSGTGKRMGNLTTEYPKCMTEISNHETILSRQLHMLAEYDIQDIVITTGPFEDKLKRYCLSLELPLNYSFVHNPIYESTNYIYSIYLAGSLLENEEILLMHGDLVFEYSVLDAILSGKRSCMAVSRTVPIPEKDFKAVISPDGYVQKIGVEFFTDAVAAWALYKLSAKDFLVWFDNIKLFCEACMTNVYAENALNEVTGNCKISPVDIRDMLCSEIDTQDDLILIREKVKHIENRSVYMCFSADIIHSGHIALIKKASRLGKLTVGILSDNAVASYKRFPLLPFKERKALFTNIKGVEEVIEQRELSYAENLNKLKPDYVVHGDDWKNGLQRPIRDEVTSILASYGGKLIEFPYASDDKYVELEKRARAELSLPDIRRKRLRKVIEMKGLVTAIEAHSGITGLIAEQTVVTDNEGKSHQFDAMWVSSLCDSTAKGKPDIELVDLTSRIRTVNDIMEVTTKPVIFDGDTGGLTQHFVYTVKTLERIGVSAVIIEDKTGLKKNSLFGTEVVQTQDSIENFSEKIRAGKCAQKTRDFMIIARIESLILEKGMEDALTRAFAFVEAGADGIMIHSRKKEPDEIFEFIEKFRQDDLITPIVVVPTSFNTVTEDEFKDRGANIVIYANQLTRSGFPAMKRTAETILYSHRAKEADDECMPIKEILTLIPEDY